jgi:UDP-galactopyranose mutase
MENTKKVLIVGAGIAGSVIARELANVGIRSVVIDKRNHIAGNCYDFVNEYGILVHKYGPHFFHTNNKAIVDWLSNFTEWFPYEHKVKAILGNGQYVTLPVNKETKEIVGEENIVDIFFRPYTKKMWNKEIEELDPFIIKRVAARDDMNEKYFPNDEYQMMPKGGYTQMWQNVLNHPLIEVRLNTEFDKSMESEYDHVFNSMPIDEYFDFVHGDLPYRSMKFHTVNLPTPRILPTTSINFTHSGPYTRMTEWQNAPGHGHNEEMTTLTYEEPCDYKDNNMERYYPVKDIEDVNSKIYNMYLEMVPSNTTFIGRCGKYVYMDMHVAIADSLKVAKTFLNS